MLCFTRLSAVSWEAFSIEERAPRSLMMSFRIRPEILVRDSASDSACTYGSLSCRTRRVRGGNGLVVDGAVINSDNAEILILASGWSRNWAILLLSRTQISLRWLPVAGLWLQSMAN